MPFDNPFTNGVICGNKVSLKTYLGQPAKRGEPGFVMHSSALRAFVKNPKKWIDVGEDEEEAKAEADENGEEVVQKNTKAQAWGNLVDCLFTMPQDFGDRYLMLPSTYENSKGREADWTWKSSTCREWRDQKQAEGWEVVAPDELDEAKTAAGRLANDPIIAALVKGAQFQVHVTADYLDPNTQLVVPVKTLIDVVGGDGEYRLTIANLKTCHDGTYKKWQSAIEDKGYDVQAALEFDIFNAAAVAAGQPERTHYVHPIQESKPPYAIGRRELGHNDHLHTGRRQYTDALAKYCQCLKFGMWPGYDDPFPGKVVLNNGWTLMECSPWHMTKWV